METTVTTVFSTEWVLLQRVKWCFDNHPLISSTFTDCFASVGKCRSVHGHTTAIFNPAGKGSWLLQISLLDLMVSRC